MKSIDLLAAVSAKFTKRIEEFRGRWKTARRAHKVAYRRAKKIADALDVHMPPYELTDRSDWQRILDAATTTVAALEDERSVRRQACEERDAAVKERATILNILQIVSTDDLPGHIRSLVAQLAHYRHECDEARDRSRGVANNSQ